MSQTVGELLESFPDKGGRFTLDNRLWQVPELLALLAATEITLGGCDPDAARLTISGTVQTPAGPVDITLRFTATGTAPADTVLGLAAQVPVGTGIAELAQQWGLNLTGVPEVFLADLRDVTAYYRLPDAAVVLLAQTAHLRVVFGRPDAGSRLSLQVGLKDVHASLAGLPFIGESIPDGESYGLRGIGAIVAGAEVTPGQAVALNSAVRTAADDVSMWWPQLPSGGLDQGGVWLAACAAIDGQDRVWAVRLGAPASWLPGFPEISFDLGAFRLRWTRFGLGPSRGGGGGGLGAFFDLSLDLGWLTLKLPDAGFDVDFSLDVGVPGFVLPVLPALGFEFLGRLLRFEVPSVDWPDLDLPGFPGLPGPGVLTGWWDSRGDGGSAKLWDLLDLLGISLPSSLPSVFNPRLPSLGLRFDWSTGDVGLIGESGWLRFVFGGLPALPQWGTAWGKAGLLGITGLRAWLGDLPFIGGLFDDILPDFLLDGISFSAIGSALSLPSFDRLTAWIGTLPSLPSGGWWPSLSWDSSGGGQGGRGLSLDLNWKLPTGPPLDWGISWGSVDLPDISWPPSGGTPDISWLDLGDLDLSLGPLRFNKIGLTWPGPGEIDWSPEDPSWVLRLVFEVSFDLGGGFSFALPGLGFDFDLKTPSLGAVRPRLPKLSFTLPGPVPVDFTVPWLPEADWKLAITAVWSSEVGVSAADIAEFFGLDVLGKAIPAFLMPRLYSVGLHLDLDRASQFLVVAGAAGIGDWAKGAWVFATQSANKRPTARRKLVALRVGTELKASDLPPAVGAAEIQYHFDMVLSGLQLAYAEQRWTYGQVVALNGYLAGLDPQGPVKLPVLLPVDMPPGFQVWGDLRVGDLLEVLLVYPDRELPAALHGGAAGSSVAAGASKGSSAEADLTGYALGPIRFSHARLGLGFGLIYLAFDASMAIGPLDVELIGLGIGVDKDLNPHPVLEGAAVRFDRPPVTIAGALVRLDLGQSFSFAMAGSGLIEIADLFSLAVAGSWAEHRDGWRSLFAYAELNAAKNRVQGLFSIGPVTFTGIALGFGINSTVRVPSVADIGRFPLIKQLGKPPNDEPLTPGQALTELAGTGGWVTPAQGQYWIAGGARFTVYKFIRARVLVLVEWGLAGWKAMFAGSTTLLLPPTVPDDDSSEARGGTGAGTLAGTRALAFIGELGKVVVDFAIVYDSALSRFSMDAVIAEGSYVLDPAATLTGGISLYVWGKSLPGISKGFVLTAGGYHPQFARTKPSYYPSPPRIGWLWERGPITFKGQAYAALTDGAFMIGVAVAAIYDQGHNINLRAWFSAHVDALVQWKPFYADLAIGLSIGVSATVKVAFIRVKVSLEVGVKVQLWLPPFGGRAQIKVWFISFSIGFGADREGAPPVPWTDFQIQLPSPTRSALKQGAQLKDVTEGESEARRSAGKAELVRLDGFSVAVESALPASKITIGGELFAGSDDARIDIRPMRLTGVVSEQAIRLRGPDGDLTAVEWTKLGWKFEATAEGMPQALWGRPLANPGQALDDPGLVPGCLTGVTITVPPPVPRGDLDPVPAANLSVEANLPAGLMPLADTAVAGPAPDATRDSIEEIRSTLVETAEDRTEVYQVLSAFGATPFPPSDGPLDRYARLVERTMTDFPYLTAAGAR